MRLIDADELIKGFDLCIDTADDTASVLIATTFKRIVNKQPTIEPTANSDKYEYHYDHTDCIWYRPEARNRCPSTCAQYRDGWNDAMNYIFRDGKGYRPYRRDKQYEERKEGADG